MAENKTAWRLHQAGLLRLRARSLILISIPLILALVSTSPHTPGADHEELAAGAAADHRSPATTRGDGYDAEGEESSAPAAPRLGSAELGSPLFDAEPVNVDLELRGGRYPSFRASRGKPLSVDADYDQARYHFEESYDETTRTYRLRLEPRSRSARSSISAARTNKPASR